LAKHFNQLSLSERRLILLTALVVVVALFVLLVWQPLIERWSKRSAQRQQVETQIAEIDRNIETLILESENDPNEKYRTQLEQLAMQIRAQQAEISSITSALISPEKMNQVFDEMLSNRQLKLLSMENRQAIAVKIPDQGDESPLLYEHGLSLHMEGSYVAVLKYIAHLESQSWKLYWDRLIYKTTDYPNGVLRLDIHTLSTSDHVLGF